MTESPTFLKFPPGDYSRVISKGDDLGLDGLAWSTSNSRS